MAADTDEMLYWMPRLAAILIVAVVFVILVLGLVPELDDSALFADAATARIAYNGGFTVSPGLVNASLFTQQTADARMRFLSDTIQREMGVRARLLLPDGSPYDPVDPIFYHRRGYDTRLEGSGGLVSGSVKDVRWLPVRIIQDDGSIIEGILELEARYAE